MPFWIRQWAANAIPTHGEHTISIGDFPRIPHGVFHIQSHELCPCFCWWQKKHSQYFGWIVAFHVWLVIHPVLLFDYQLFIVSNPDLYSTSQPTCHCTAVQTWRNTETTNHKCVLLIISPTKPSSAKSHTKKHVKTGTKNSIKGSWTRI